MSIDGAGLLSSDLAHDVYTEILQLFAAGVSAGEIQSHIESFESDFSDKVDEDSYLAAALKGFWEVGAPTQMLHRRLSALLESGAIRSRWSDELGVRFATSREKTIHRLLLKTATPNPRPKRQPRQNGERAKPLHDVGDCLELGHDHSRFRCVICAVYPYRQSYAYLLVPLHSGGSADSIDLRDSRYVGHMVGHYAAPSGYVYGVHGAIATQRVLNDSNLNVIVIGRLLLDESAYTSGGGAGIHSRADSMLGELARTLTNTRRGESFSTSTLLKQG